MFVATCLINLGRYLLLQTILTDCQIPHGEQPLSYPSDLNDQNLFSHITAEQLLRTVVFS